MTAFGIPRAEKIGHPPMRLEGTIRPTSYPPATTSTLNPNILNPRPKLKSYPRLRPIKFINTLRLAEQSYARLSMRFSLDNSSPDLAAALVAMACSTAACSNKGFPSMIEYETGNRHTNLFKFVHAHAGIRTYTRTYACITCVGLFVRPSACPSVRPSVRRSVCL